MTIRPAIGFEPYEAAAVLAGLVALDLQQLRELRPQGWPSVADLIRSGRLRYSRVDPDEHWQSYREILQAVQRFGVADADCEDLAALVAAEYRYTGQDPGAVVHVYRTGPNLSHVVVRRSNGNLEDPSRAAGMGQAALVSS